MELPKTTAAASVSLLGPSPLPKHKRTQVRSGALRWTLLGPPLLIIFLTVIYPLGASLITSFREWRMIFSPTPGPFVGLDNYRRALSDGGFLNALQVSLVYTVLSVALTLLIGLGIALLLSKPTRLNVFARTLLILPFAVAPILKGYSWRFMLDPDYGVYARMIGAVVPPLKGFVWLGNEFTAMLSIAMSEVWGWAPLFALMFIGALGSIPGETTEAAKVDGATATQIFFRITLPLLAPVIYIVALLKIISSFKMFDQVVVMTGGGPGDSTQTLYYFIYQLGFRNLDMGYASAVSYLLFIIMAIFAALYVRVLLRDH